MAQYSKQSSARETGTVSARIRPCPECKRKRVQEIEACSKGYSRSSSGEGGSKIYCFDIILTVFSRIWAQGDMSSPRTEGSLTPEEIAEALGDDAEPEHPSSSSSGSSAGGGSDKTVRLHTRSPSSFNANSRPQQAPRQTPPESSRGSPPWQIYFRKPPGSAVVLEGPFAWESLQSSLGLVDETVNASFVVLMLSLIEKLCYCVYRSFHWKSGYSSKIAVLTLV